MARQRVRVRGVDAWLTAAIAVASGIGVAIAGVSPTGGAVIDVVIAVVATAACVWAAASAPWWAGVVAAAIATALAPTGPLLLIGAAAMVGGLVIGLARRAVPWSRALVAGAAVQVLARLGNFERFGVSSLISLSLLAALAYLGLRRRPRRDRRTMWIVVAAVAGVVVIASIGFGIAALGARSDLQAGNREARAGLDLLGNGDFNGARESFARAMVLFDRADGVLSKPWTQPARLVPILAQHRTSAVELADDASRVSSSISKLLEVIDYDSLRVVNGRIDIASIELLEAPLTELTAAVDELEATVSNVNSPWLVEALGSRLDDLAADLRRQQTRGDNALAAVRQAPEMLGADGPRVYFIAFTTPAEARGLGGFMGNWAEVTITDGRLRLTDFGRTLDLNDGGDVGSKTLTGPQELLRNYGDFLLSDTQAGIVGPQAWSNITASPDFPAVAQVIHELYPQSGGKALDGVFVMDVETIARLMQIGGPVQLDDLGIEVTPDNAVSFLMREQYLLPENEDRVDALETVARTTVDRLLTSELPPPPDLAKLLGPMAAQGRLAGWATRPAEQAVFQRIGMSGALPVRASDGLAITLNNAAGSKIDDLLDAKALYSVQPDPANGTAAATLTITLTNTAPTSGLPDSIIGNVVDLPTGTNSTYLSVYTALPFTSATVDGKPYPFSLGVDSGYLVTSAFIDIAPGATTTVVLELEGGLDLRDGYSLVVRTPPTARPFPVTAVVNGVTLTDAKAGQPGIRRYRS